MKKGILNILILLIIFPGSAFAQNYAKLVDTKIGSEGRGLGCGYNYIGASYPFGMVQFTPSFLSTVHRTGKTCITLNETGCNRNMPTKSGKTFTTIGAKELTKIIFGWYHSTLNV